MIALRERLERHRTALLVAVVLALILAGLVALQALTREVHYKDVRTAIHGLTPAQIVLALTFTAGSYLALTFYDVLALRIIGRPLPWRTAALASFTSYTLSHNLGLSPLTGGSARYRVYTAAGLDGPDVARIIGLAGGTFWVGVATVAGYALLSHDGAIDIAGLKLSVTAAHLLGSLAIAAVVALIVLSSLKRGPLRLFGMTLPLPGPGQLLLQIGIALVDIACASAALYVLMPGATPELLPTFILAYSLGIVAAVLTHVPGGIGIFEAVVLAVVPGNPTALFAALIAYRVIYYLIPLALGVTMLLWHEGMRQRRSAKVLAGVQMVASNLSPLVMSAATFLGGAMLLLSGSLPALHARMGDLSSILPLPFIEASHVAASLVGTGLLFLAPALYRRLDAAFYATRLLLVAGAIFSLTKGIDYEEAIVCLTLAALLQWTRGAYYRRTALTQAPLSAAWIASAAGVLSLTAWAGFFAYRRVPYGDDLWWEFALRGDAPRFLRSTLAVALALAGIAIWRWFAPVSPKASRLPAKPDPATIRSILAKANRTDAMLALTGDKRFLVSDSGDAFLMYQIKGASWIVMGDPVGPITAWGDLLWEIRELADQNQGRLLLYEISPAALDLSIGLGLQIVKFGEEAVVDLDHFTLDTPLLRSVRKSARTVTRAGAEFRIVPAAAVPVIIDELAAISDEWLEEKGQSEKSFSLGRFERDYISKFDVGVVTVDQRIVAFANLWLTPNKKEASVDLMRHRTGAPRGCMDFLFVELMQWSKDRGYRRFSLGMAPLSGIDGRRLAPIWARVAALVFRHGEGLYGFRGLRGYKEKFAPIWEPRYVAGPHSLGLVQGMRDLARLIGRGIGKPARAIPSPIVAQPELAS